MFAGLLYRVTFTFWGGIRVTFEPDSLPDARPVRLAFDEVFYYTPLFHRPRKRRFAYVLLALIEAPRLPRLVQFRPRHLELGPELALVPKNRSITSVSSRYSAVAASMAL